MIEEINKLQRPIDDIILKPQFDEYMNKIFNILETHSKEEQSYKDKFNQLENAINSYDTSIDFELGHESWKMQEVLQEIIAEIKR